jgi:AcrR family transcriptional regulator
MEKEPISGLINRCLSAFVQAGTLDLSLDQISRKVGISKRMLVHYFGSRDHLEEQAIETLEDQLLRQFSPQNYPAGIPLKTVLLALWKQATAPESRGVLLLTMDLSRRAWNGSARAKAFYGKQRDLWVELLMKYHPHRTEMEEVLQLFQGATLFYLITGDPEPGRRSLERFAAALARRGSTR